MDLVLYITKYRMTYLLRIISASAVFHYSDRLLMAKDRRIIVTKSSSRSKGGVPDCAILYFHERFDDTYSAPRRRILVLEMEYVQLRVGGGFPSVDDTLGIVLER